MEVKATTRYVRISAFKARSVTRHIQGLPALNALELLEFYPQKAARFISKTLRSAIANAENNNSLDPQNLVVKEAVVGEGPTIKRFRPRARGSAGPILKRTSHVRIVLAERAEEPVETKKSRTAKKGAGRKSGAKAAKE